MMMMSFICSFRNKNEHTDECDILTPVIPQVEEQREHTFAAPQQGDALELGEAVDVTDHERSTARSIPLPQKKKSSRVLHLLTVNLCILHGSCQPPPECGQPKAFCRFLSLSLSLSLSTLYNRFKELMAGCPKPFYTALQASRTRHHAGNKFVGAGCRTLALPASAFSAPGAR